MTAHAFLSRHLSAKTQPGGGGMSLVDHTINEQSSEPVNKADSNQTTQLT